MTLAYSPALGKLRQKDHHNFEANWAIGVRCCLKEDGKEKLNALTLLIRE